MLASHHVVVYNLDHMNGHWRLRFRSREKDLHVYLNIQRVLERTCPQTAIGAVSWFAVHVRCVT